LFALINLKKTSMTNVSNISKGLVLIEQYESDAILTAEHDQIWCGQGNGKSVTEITDEGKAIMEALGWFIDENLGCWSFYV
jgi:hypothetical protein